MLPKLLAASVLLLLPVSGSSADEPVANKYVLQADKTASGVWVKQGDGRKVLFYQTAAKDWDGKFRRANYVHPLYDLDGHVLTEDFPKDHRHHRGIFWAWHQTWIGERKIGDAWIARRFAWEVVGAKTESARPDVVLHTQVEWKSPDWLVDGKPAPFAREHVQIRVGAVRGGARTIDFWCAFSRW